MNAPSPRARGGHDLARRSAATTAALPPGSAAVKPVTSLPPPSGGVAGTPRTWRIEMPAGMELLNANERHHWSRRARITGEIRRAAAWLAKAQRIPRLERAQIVAEYQPPDRHKRDPANLYPAVKAAVDGICLDAGVLVDDDAAHLIGPDMRLGERYPKGRLVLTVTELAP